MPTTTSIFQLTPLLSPRPDLLENLVRVWRAARADRLQFLTDLHSAEEDATHLSRVVLAENQVWIAQVDGIVAGFIAFANGWVHQLYVAPPFQGRGVGSELLAIAKRCNRTLQLWVFEVNLPAIRFYEHQGFRTIERTDGAANEAKRPDRRMQWNGEQLKRSR